LYAPTSVKVKLKDSPAERNPELKRRVPLITGLLTVCVAVSKFHSQVTVVPTEITVNGLRAENPQGTFTTGLGSTGGRVEPWTIVVDTVLKAGDD
jgi:hypothetical protein